GDIVRFEKLFQRDKDPWNFSTSKYEKNRFNTILEFVKMIKPQSILELGCAEGHLTKQLFSICSDLTAVEISETAIQRAEQMVPGPKFVSGDLTKIKFTKKFSVILAAEVLYYLKEEEIIRFIENCQTDYLLISGFFNQYNLLRKYDFKKVKNKWIFRFEFSFPFLKITDIYLWKKN
ncbi:MAG: nodulation S family protein, partial [Actinobacteria bacterium]|nr:nodulation S family protein [Actinomycetota bacterium]